MPNARLKSKRFIGLWINHRLLNKLKKAANKNKVSLSGYIVNLLHSQKRPNTISAQEPQA